MNDDKNDEKTSSGQNPAKSIITPPLPTKITRDDASGLMGDVDKDDKSE